MRLKDRFYDLHLHLHMQKVVGDRLRPDGKKDPHGVEDARKRLTVALDMIDAEMAGKTWAMGDEFTMADCAAAPPLFYIDKVFPLADKHKNAAAYLHRLLQRPSYARAIEEATALFLDVSDLTRLKGAPMLKIFAVMAQSPATAFRRDEPDASGERLPMTRQGRLSADRRRRAHWCGRPGPSPSAWRNGGGRTTSPTRSARSMRGRADKLARST